MSHIHAHSSKHTQTHCSFKYCLFVRLITVVPPQQLISFVVIKGGDRTGDRHDVTFGKEKYENRYKVNILQIPDRSTNIFLLFSSININIKSIALVIVKRKGI